MQLKGAILTSLPRECSHGRLSSTSGTEDATITNTKSGRRNSPASSNQTRKTSVKPIYGGCSPAFPRKGIAGECGCRLGGGHEGVHRPVVFQRSLCTASNEIYVSSIPQKPAMYIILQPCNNHWGGVGKPRKDLSSSKQTAHKMQCQRF